MAKLVKGENIFKILEMIERSAFTAADILEVLFASRQEVYRRMHSNQRKYRESFVEKIKEDQKFYNLLNYLQRKGLVKKEKSGTNFIWKITRRGEEKLEKLKERLLKRPERKTDPIQKTKKVIILSFDIPEYDRKKRDWLRETLKGLGYKMVHKSVWIAKIELPIEFLEDLRRHHLLNYIHIFSINQKGTISNFKI